MKVEILKRNVEVKETELEYPIYLYTQVDGIENHYSKITEKERIDISFYLSKTTIEIKQRFLSPIEEYQLKNMTSKQTWDKAVADIPLIS